MIDFIEGGIAKDNRGQVRFVNDFDMKEVKRFYLIKNSDVKLIRGWRGHKIEQRWFYVLSGSFSISIVKIDNWENPDRSSPVDELILDSSSNKLLYLSPGYATAIKAILPESEILVFADYPLSHSKLDDHTYELDYFANS